MNIYIQLQIAYCNYAALMGNLDMLVRLREIYGYHWDASAIEWAYIGQNEEVVQYVAKKQGLTHVYGL